LAFRFLHSFDIWILTFGFKKKLEDLQMEIRKIKQFLRDERGAVLAIALLIMIALALIGAAAMITSTMELDIARNERLAKESFYAADGGTTLAPIFIEEAAVDHALPVMGGVTIDPDFLDELLGYTTPNDTPSSTPPDIATEVNGKKIDVDVDRVATQVLAGGAAEFAGGYEGIGAGAASGGIAIIYRIDSQGSAAATSKSVVESYYRKVVNIARE
jgi:Tfp pilus assembly protein PilX